MHSFRKLILGFLLTTSFYNVVKAQKINVPLVECLGNLTSYSYTPPSGLTLSAATWDFGDGNGSSNLTPLHTYAAKGFYTVKINATFTNSSTRVDSVKIEVVGLPKAAFYRLTKIDTCYFKNHLSYVDTSRPAITGQDIKSRLMVWGDGDFVTSNTPKYGDTLSHTYPTAATYTLKLEVTDKYGCKNSRSQTVTILDDIDADAYIDTSWADCITAQICVRNTSKGNNVKGGSYRWIIDTSALDTNSYFGLLNKKCLTYKKSKTVKVMLIAIAKSGCRDTFISSRILIADTLENEMELSDTVVCRSADGQMSAIVKRRVWDTVYWKMDGVYDRNVRGPAYYFSPKSSLSNGIHIVTAQIVRGTCGFVINRTINVIGPLATMRIYDNNQCSSNRPLFFADESFYIQRSNAIYRWRINDLSGGNCTNNRAKNINKYKNCNRSVDWYTKHQFSNTDSSYLVNLWIKDTVSGCEDSVENTVYFKKCPPILNYDSVVLCQGDVFMQVAPQFPEYVTLDTGKTWKRFSIVLDSSHKGWYDVGFAFKTIRSPWAENFGADSVKLHTDSITSYDTAYKKKYLKVNPLKRDDFTLKIYGQCKPFRVTLDFKSGKFLKGEKLSVNGGTDYLFTKDSTIDSLFFVYNTTGFQSFMRIRITNKEGCRWIKSINFSFGKGAGYYIPKIPICINSTSVCLSPMILENNPSYYWTKGSLNNRKISWQFDDSVGTNYSFNPCHIFTKGGAQGFKMITQDSFGCLDTQRGTVSVQEVKANVKYLSKTVYCSELKQFFDSSSFLKLPLIPPDSIKKYSWKFGDNVYSSFAKNPLQVINTYMDSIKVTLATEMLWGCSDTFSFYLKIIGPHPYFQIKDTIGCGSLLATFINTSRNCKSYLWEYGDPLTSTLQTNSKANTAFNYTTPGRYYIYLTGYDTVFNPLTGKTFYCKNTFPDKLFQKDTTRSVLVLPFKTTGIQSSDTVCLGSPFILKSLSDTAYQFDYWQMGDSATYNVVDGSTINHTYKKEGTYHIKLNPTYTDILRNKYCLDSAQKDVLVVKVKANFDIDLLPIPPLFQFYNKSNPASSLLKWNFGHPNSGSDNISNLQNPSHNYGNDTGHYNVCLIASIPEGCSDTICKTVYNDHLTEFQIFNVFTPGNIDGKNDQYDILIEGEDLYDLEIYNRWGVLVFKGEKDGDKNNDTNWNGKVLNKGEDCPAGTYYFIFRYSLRTDPKDIKTLTGVVTLIR